MTTECPQASAQPLPESPKPGWIPSSSSWKCSGDIHLLSGPNREVSPGFRAAPMSAPAFPCPARSLSLPECTPYHTSRDIRYIFLESCRNIPASQHPLDGAGASSVPPGPAPCHPTAQHYLSTDEDCDSSLPQQLLAFSTRLRAEAMDVRGSPDGKKRLPVFRRLCGEAVEELKKFPDAQAAPGSAKGWRIPLAGGRAPGLQQGMN
ncbi:PREDICTED: serine/threonine-protein kinase WNK4-like isoform X2 [Ficedula albicollis]|nr:PREDICTED: serine/threonine-protein kinase WNK4-like isoform X2 [Ficedula albicollis]XP_016158417.1 PREDICTED: serine/threonine-protein kinase WNK4-like isoform X2 [Ficedula albicollis]